MSRAFRRKTALLSDAEAAENQVEDVVIGGCAGDLVERTERTVEIEQKHLVRNAVVDGGLGGVEGGQGITHQGLMTRIRQESGFGGGPGVSGYVAEDGSAKLGDACTG
jgi:hypothetical protein